MQHSASFQVYNASAGSGKTFTLVKEYLKILLASSNVNKFQQILAVTFTNKAAAEMKQRVIENLNDYAKGNYNDLLNILTEETSLSEAEIFKKSNHILNAILQNYGGFNITTIDSFTHKLIRTFAYDLNLPMNFEVEMDAVTLLNEAVDVVISKIGENKELTNLLVNYALQKTEDDKSWDISLDLKEFAKIMLDETHINKLKSFENISLENFNRLKKKLREENKLIEREFANIGQEGLDIIRENGLEFNEFAQGGELPNHFKKLLKISELKEDSLKFEGRLNNSIEEEKKLYSAKCPANSRQIIESIKPQLSALYYKSKELYEQKYSVYLLNKLIMESLIPLATLSYIYNELQQIKLENNILLNAEFNQKISETIKNEPAPFIYERLGEKFRYYFIDEMQDTSQLQWQNIIPLISHAITSENEMGERGKLMLVGDGKQSIYRWRGGKTEQFIALSAQNGQGNESNPFMVEKQVMDLGKNFRSYSQIIDFNNRFFTFIAESLSNKNHSELYANGNQQEMNKKVGGFVQLSFIDKTNDKEERDLSYSNRVLEIIQNLDPAFKRSEVCVLVRTNKQGVTIADYLAENKVNIISSETLLLNNNTNINFLINLLNVIENPTHKEFKMKLLYFLHSHLNINLSKHQFFKSCVDLNNQEFFQELQKYGSTFHLNEFIQSPFYESIEYSIRSFQLAKESDADIQFFLDVVFEFQQKYSHNLTAFLEYWELKKGKLSIVAPEAKNSVRIMTIHKAKGLEFPVVIFPYDINMTFTKNEKVWYPYHKNGFKEMLVKYSKKLQHTGEEGNEIYNSVQEELQLDNFNILYVALTRAVEQLYVVSEKKPVKNFNNISEYFIDFLMNNNLWNEEKSCYNFGSPERISMLDNKKEDTETVLLQNFVSNSWKNHNISIVANSSLLWGSLQGDAMIYGNLLHEILSKIKTENDVKYITNQYLFKGIITAKQHRDINELLMNIITHPQLKTYFEKGKKVLTEKEMITVDRQIAIPDRLIFNNEKVNIIDYKTGKKEASHKTQINNYALALENLNYTIEKKLLVYINSEIFVEEV